MDEIGDPTRRGVLVAGVAGIGLAWAGPAFGSNDSKVSAVDAGVPPQAWASRGGVLEIGVNAPAVADAHDMLMIQQVFARYGMAYDEGLGPVLRTLFTDSAVLELAQGQAKPFKSFQGRENIVMNFLSAFQQQADQRRHCFTNIIIEERAGNQARTLAYALVSVASEGAMIIGSAVVYTGNLIKEGGVWKFAKLYIGMDAYTTPKPKV